MKIGILTFHRAHNYGAVLQCYALQEVLKGMGHEVEVIDYRQPAIEKDYNHWGILPLVKKLIKCWKLKAYLKLLIKERTKRSIFDKFKKDYLILTEKCDASNIPCDYDAYVIGSDQLFTTEITHGLDSVYSGQFKRNEHSKLIGYAISSNSMAIDDIGAEGWKAIYKRFDALSMREKTLVEKIYGLSKINIRVCVDPTILTTENVWTNMLKKPGAVGGYVVMYEVRITKDRDMLKRKTEELAMHNHLRIIDLSSMAYQVEDWVSYIKNAECVVTSSFHASVFALIFQRPLYAFKLEDGRDYRYTDLLQHIGLNELIKGSDDSIIEIPKIDYTNVMPALEEYKSASMNFLLDNLIQ